MHAILPLAAGVNGAANGSVSIYKRGTTTYATYYTGFDATGPVTPAAAVTLDANGGGVFYVNELVDVTVKDSNGNTVRSFTAGDAAPAVEVISQSFTGVDYTTGQSGASKPTTLQTILDAWKTSAGTLDFKVLSGGVATLLQTVVANSITSLFFNVKAASYGAVGDGATDDTTAIAAAITAASAAGGGTVYFPKGTYKVTAQITVPVGVSLLGSGAGASTIFGTAGGSVISITGTPGQWTYIRDLYIYSQAPTAMVIVVDGSIRIEGCTLGDGTIGLNTINVAPGGPGTAPLAFVISCTLRSPGGAVQRSHFTLSNGNAKCVGCTFVYPSGSYDLGVSINGAVDVIGCTFQLGTVTSGTATIYSPGASGYGLLVGNRFEAVGGAGVPVINACSASWVGGGQEVANAWATGYTFPAFSKFAAPSGLEGVQLLTRAVRSAVLATDATPITVPTNTVGTYEVTRSNNSAQTLNFPDPPGAGHIFTLNFNNNQAGASGTITMGGTNIRGLTTFTVNANRMSLYTFKSIFVNAPGQKYLWTLIASDVNETP